VVAFLIEHHAELFLTHVDTERLGTAVATVRDTYVPDANSGELMLRRKQPLFLLRRLEPSDVTRWRAANAALAAASVSAEDIQRRRSVPKGAGISHQSLSMLFPPSRASVPFTSACTGEGGAADLDTDAASASSDDDDNNADNSDDSSHSAGETHVDAVLVASSKAKARPTGRGDPVGRRAATLRPDSSGSVGGERQTLFSAPARCCVATAANSRRRRATRMLAMARRAASTR
jgi:hypothetical protein